MQPGPRRRSPATRATPPQRAWRRRYTAARPRRATRCSPLTATATSSRGASRLIGSTRRTATSGWPPTRTTPARAATRRITCGRSWSVQGTPALNGIFEDKPELEVDRTGGRFDGNVYVCWSRFVGFNGRTQISFSRSTDSGQTFSHPILLSDGKDVQGCDIAIEHDGDVYVTWGTRNTPSAIDAEGLAIARSVDGGATFQPARQIATFTRYFPSDGARDCGDGALVCPSRFVFFRVPLEPRVTADPSGLLSRDLRHVQRGRPDYGRA